MVMNKMKKARRITLLLILERITTRQNGSHALLAGIYSFGGVANGIVVGDDNHLLEKNNHVFRNGIRRKNKTWCGMKADNDSFIVGVQEDESAYNEEKVKNNSMERNKRYIEGLLENLSSALDKWIMNGSPATRMRAYNILKQIEQKSMDEELKHQATRMVQRAGMPLEEPPPVPSPPKPAVSFSGSEQRKEEAKERLTWENQLKKDAVGRSILSTRASSSLEDKTDAFVNTLSDLPSTAQFADDKQELHGEIMSSPSTQPTESTQEEAAALASELIARAGAGDSFSGSHLGIGGLDSVLNQIKRRIWVPLAAPPSLLQELGIHPVRGLLLYGLPGCGKTLLARTIGGILSPLRPLTIVSGPEIMDKFVGSSEANLREIFDAPPPLYDNYRQYESLGSAALHVIVLDEFDAIARIRGGRGGKGDQGDAGVARDSVVNQLLAKMDGVDPLIVPTLVIGLTNKRTLIEPALLRPGRFEVQIEVPPPRTKKERVSILNVHMKNMFEKGRVLVKDAKEGTVAWNRLKNTEERDHIPTYEQLLDLLAIECDGMTGASLAAVCRAAASRALERAVWDFAGHVNDNDDEKDGHLITNCLVTKNDFEKAIEDVFESSSVGDYSEDDGKGEEKEAKKDEDMSDTENNEQL